MIAPPALSGGHVVGLHCPHCTRPLHLRHATDPSPRGPGWTIVRLDLAQRALDLHLRLGCRAAE